MADTKISALTGISGGTLADGDKFAVADASDLSASYSATAANIKTYVENGPNWAAGSSTNGSWPQVSSGTVQTTPDAGTFPEYDGNCFYGTVDAGNRGVIPCMNIIRLTADYTLTSSTSEQKLFNASTNGRLTLETGAYVYQCIASISGLSATSGNGAFDILGAGTATLTDVLYHSIGVDGNTATAATQTGSTMIQGQSPASQQTAGTGTTWNFRNFGTFEVTAAGTIVPSVTLVTAAAGVVRAGSMFLCYRIGASNANTLVGQWD